MAMHRQMWARLCLCLWMVLAAAAKVQVNASSGYRQHMDREMVKKEGIQGQPSVVAAVTTASKDVQSLAELLEEFYGNRSLEERMALVRFLNKRAKQRSAKLEAVVDTALAAYRIIAPFVLMRMALRWKARVKQG